jgi:hypothetical protein
LRLQRKSAPDHPEYGASALLTTSDGHLVLTVWTERAWSLRRVGDDGWTVLAGGSEGETLEALRMRLEALGVPSVEAASVADEAVRERRERWEARKGEVRWPLFDLAVCGAAAAVAVPAAAGAAVIISNLARLVRRA